MIRQLHSCKKHSLLVVGSLIAFGLIPSGLADTTDTATKSSNSTNQNIDLVQLGRVVQELEDNLNYLESAVGSKETGEPAIIDESHCGTRRGSSMTINQRLTAANNRIRYLTHKLNQLPYQPAAARQAPERQ